jgi:hypothetical protein
VPGAKLKHKLNVAYNFLSRGNFLIVFCQVYGCNGTTCSQMGEIHDLKVQSKKSC